jgi:hypothetical protein
VSPSAAEHPPRIHTPRRRRIEIVTDWRPHSAQQAAVLAATEDEIDVTCGRRWGKTTGIRSWLTGIFEGATWGAIHTPGGRFWYAAPTIKPACKDFYNGLKNTLGDLIIQKNDTDLWVKLFNKATIECKTLEDADNLRGPGLDGLAIDEKGTVAAYAWDEVLGPMLADPPERCRRRASRWGTPKGKKHWTYREHMTGLRGAPGPGGRASFQFPTWARPGMVAVCEKFRQKMPENAFRQEFGAEFLDNAAGFFDMLPEAHDGKPPPQIPDPRGVYAAGFDFGHVDDWNVGIVVQASPTPMRVVAFERFGRTAWPVVKARGVNLFRRWDAGALIDATAGGAPGEVVAEAFKPDWQRVEGFDFRSSAGGGREALLQNLNIMIATGELTLPGTYEKPAFPVLTQELEGFQYQVLPNGKARGAPGPGLDDDCVMALALAAWAAKRGAATSYVPSRKTY